MNRTNALRALYNLCAFIGAIVLFSYFYNWAVDLRHWYVTLASAFACSILWLGFYVIEVRGGVRHAFSQIAPRLSHLRTKSELQSPSAELPALPADPPSEVTTPNPLPWVRAAGK